MALAAFQGTAVDNSGNVIPFANVEVRLDAPGRPVQPIFADFEGTDPLGTTFQADENGKFRFHAPGGFYWIRSYEGPSQSPDREHILRYVAIGTAAARDIEALAAELETGTAPFATKAALDDFTPDGDTVGAKVLNDPDPANNGLYIWDAGEEDWVWVRPLFDTLARLNITGGTADDIAAALSPGVDSAQVVMLFIEIAENNTGPVTINGLDLLTVDNEPLIAGHLVAGRTYFLTDEGDHFRLRNETDVAGLVAAAEAAAISALQSEQSASASEGNAAASEAASAASAAAAAASASDASDSADRAEQAATDVENPVSYAPQVLSLAAQAQARLNVGLSNLRLFTKADPYAVAFLRTGNGTISIKAGTQVEVAGTIYVFVTDTAVTMPSLTAGTDYAIWIKPDGTLEATANFSSPPVANSRRLGGFHYAPGGNASGFNSGGNSTPQINPHSLWDEKFRPACPDPRGMVLVAGGFWVDIYLCGVNHHTDGTSKYNVTIADGNSPPKVPIAFGGNGSATYSGFNWWEAAEVMASHGKELLSYQEFAAAAYGTSEATDGSTDPVSTILRASFTSIWGIMLASGNMWVWGREFGGDHAAASWSANTGGRGSTHTLSNVARFGGSWSNGSNAGSRASSWNVLPSDSSNNIGARGRSDHLCHV